MSKDFLKYISRLSKKEQDKILMLLKKIEVLDIDNLDIKKMSGFENRFRLRSGKIRIIFGIGNGLGIIYEVNTRGNIY